MGGELSLKKKRVGRVEARPLLRELVDGAVTAITSIFYILRPSLLAYRFVRQSL